MNERIKELVRQAGAETWSRAPMRAVTGLAFTDENLEKFAELIVQECIGVLNKRFMGDLNREDMEVLRCIADVKKHLGVEE
jgi:hypothetical protein